MTHFITISAQQDNGGWIAEVFVNSVRVICTPGFATHWDAYEYAAEQAQRLVAMKPGQGTEPPIHKPQSPWWRRAWRRMTGVSL